MTLFRFMLASQMLPSSTDDNCARRGGRYDYDVCFRGTKERPLRAERVGAIVIGH